MSIGNKEMDIKTFKSRKQNSENKKGYIENENMGNEKQKQQNLDPLGLCKFLKIIFENAHRFLTKLWFFQVFAY